MTTNVLRVIVLVDAAPPPDVRRGSAPPQTAFLSYGLCPSFGLSPTCAGRARTKGIARFQLNLPPAGRSPASHPAAKPCRSVFITDDLSPASHPAAKPRRSVFITHDLSDGPRRGRAAPKGALRVRSDK
jgi:hypothetical protein